MKPVEEYILVAVAISAVTIAFYFLLEWMAS